MLRFAAVPGNDKLTPADAAIFETFVVPRYLTLFADLVLEMILLGDSARVLHFGCRTGYPDLKLYERASGIEILGVDDALPAIELARNKAALLAGARIEYRASSALPLEVDAGGFTHAYSVHPLFGRAERAALFGEMGRVLCPGGQALMALPLRGSFQEIADLLREYALKFDDREFGAVVDAALPARPNIESLSDEMEEVGFEDVDVELRRVELLFESGRALYEDPMSRLLIFPELCAWLGRPEISRPLRYVCDAIDRYWSEAKFALTVNVGCASARWPGDQ